MTLKGFDINSKFGTKLSTKVKYNGLSEQNIFIDTISLLEDCNFRTQTIEFYGLGTKIYDEPFYAMINNLILLKYGKTRSEIICWWVYSRWSMDGDLKPLPNKWKKYSQIVGDVFLETPTELWNFIKNIEK